MAMKRFCCRWNLRTGSLVCAVWTLIWCVYSIALPLYTIYHHNDPYGDYIFSSTTTLSVFDEEAQTVPTAVHWSQGGVAFVTMLAAILLIIAVMKNKSHMMIPWMLMVIVLMLINAVSLVYNIKTQGLSKQVTGFLLIWIITGLMNLYCEFCVFAHYKEVKSGRGRPEDYRSESVRYQIPEVKHVHISDGTMGYIQSQRTIYSFQSQTLYEDEKLARGAAGGAAGGSHQKLPHITSNGRIFELRPVAAKDDQSRIGANAYTGSIEMRIVDSMPVIIDRSNHISNYAGSMDMQPGGGGPGRRPKRFRTVSESAANRPQPLIAQSRNSNSSVGNSLKNLTVGRAAPRTVEISNQPSTSGISNNKDKLAVGTTSFYLGSSSRIARDSELSPLTHHKEEEEEETSLS